MTIEVRETGLNRLRNRKPQLFEIGQPVKLRFRQGVTIGNYLGGTAYGTRTITELPDRRVEVLIDATLRLPGYDEPVEIREAYDINAQAINDWLGSQLSDGTGKNVKWKPSPHNPKE